MDHGAFTYIWYKDPSLVLKGDPRRDRDERVERPPEMTFCLKESEKPQNAFVICAFTLLVRKNEELFSYNPFGLGLSALFLSKYDILFYFRLPLRLRLIPRSNG